MESYHIIVVGSGGTGTYLLKELSRYLQGGLGNITAFTIIDGDTVEDKNLERQSFAEDDIGFNKAAVMADVLSSAFSVPWTSYAEYLVSLEQLDNIFYNDSIPVIFGCVDNHACRLLLEEYFDKKDTIVYYDSANEFATGEVVFAYKKDGKVISPYRSHYFPEIKQDNKKRTEMSCEELNNVAPQHIATNMAAGNILLKEFTAFLSGSPHAGLVTFDLDMYYQEFLPYIKENTVVA